MSEEKQVLFHINQEVFGINIIYVKGIEKYANVSVVPNAPSYIEGIINLRGEIIPVVSLRDRFNMPKVVPTDETMLIIAKSSGVAVAFEVDKVSEIVEVEDSNMSEPPALIRSSNTKYIGCVAHIKDKLVILLEVDGILSENEKEVLEEIIKE